MELLKDMEGFEEMEVISSDESNQILGSQPRYCENTIIEFSGKNNILYLEEGVRLVNARIHFSGDNGLVYVSRNGHKFNADITMETDSACVFGRNIFMGTVQPLRVHCRQGTSMVMGNDCLLSLGIEIDTRMSDINAGSSSAPESRSILIGQHVWLGQNVTIKGGSILRSGAVIGSDSVVSGQKILACTCWAGKEGELRKIYDHIVFLKTSIRNTPKAELWQNDEIGEEEMQSLLEAIKRNWTPVLDMVESVPAAEDKLSLLLQNPGKRSNKKYIVREKIEDGSGQESQEPNNRIIGNYTNDNSEICFLGTGNVVIFEDGVTLKDSKINLVGDNNLIYFSRSESPYIARISMHTDTTLYFGKDNRFSEEERVTISAAEAQSILIGNNCRFGRGIWFRTSDQHPMYDQETRKRVNPPKSILVGDGSVLKDHVNVFKGKKIGIRKGLLKNRYERVLEKLQNTTDMEERIGLLKKL